LAVKPPAIHEAKRISAGPGRYPLAGQALHQISGHIDNMGRALDGFRLMFFEPQQFVPGRSWVRRLACDAMNLSAAIGLDFRRRTNIHPGDSRSNRLCLVIKADKGFALVRDRNGSNAVSTDF
jgi:hypothetical protein